MKRRLPFVLRIEYEPGFGPWHVMFKHYGVARLATPEIEPVFADQGNAASIIAVIEREGR